MIKTAPPKDTRKLVKVPAIRLKRRFPHRPTRVIKSAKARAKRKFEMPEGEH